jgi:hypothetical protein
MSNISQRARPLADRLAIDITTTRAANNGSKWISILVERQTSRFKRMPQKFLRFSPYFEMFDNSEHGFQISVNGIACPAGLKIIPGTTNPLKPSHEPSFWSFALSLAKWPA